MLSVRTIRSPRASPGALDLANSLGDSGWQSRAKVELSIIHFIDGEPEEGRALLKGAMLSALFHFDRPSQVLYGSTICAGQLEMGKADEALDYCDKALKLAATVKDMGYPFQAYAAKGRALVQLGRHREAQQILEAALAKTKKLDMRLEESQTLIILGKESEAVGDLPRAIRYFEQAGELSRANGFEHSIAWSMFEAAEAYRSAGDLQKGGGTGDPGDASDGSGRRPVPSSSAFGLARRSQNQARRVCRGGSTLWPGRGCGGRHAGW